MSSHVVGQRRCVRRRTYGCVERPTSWVVGIRGCASPDSACSLDRRRWRIGGNIPLPMPLLWSGIVAHRAMAHLKAMRRDGIGGFNHGESWPSPLLGIARALHCRRMCRLRPGRYDDLAPTRLQGVQGCREQLARQRPSLRYFAELSEAGRGCQAWTFGRPADGCPHKWGVDVRQKAAK